MTDAIQLLTNIKHDFDRIIDSYEAIGRARSRIQAAVNSTVIDKNVSGRIKRLVSVNEEESKNEKRADTAWRFVFEEIEKIEDEE